VTRLFGASVLTAFLFTAVQAPLAIARQSSSTPQKQEAKPAPDESDPPEEDESLIPEKVPLNPMEAERSIRVGTFYMHKGKFRAALQRFELATKYNPSSPDAFFKVGEAEEKLKNTDAAKMAFEKVVHLAPNTKLAQEAQKKIDKKS
jgi:tetratricopeptide (TPR) repeat protein